MVRMSGCQYLGELPDRLPTDVKFAHDHLPIQLFLTWSATIQYDTPQIARYSCGNVSDSSRSMENKCVVLWGFTVEANTLSFATTIKLIVHISPDPASIGKQLAASNFF